MKKPKYVLALALSAQSTLAFAHGEEVLVTFFLELLTFVILAFALFTINLNRIGKLILGVICALTIALTFIATNRLPYTKYQNTINLLVVGAPLTAGAICYITLRNRFGKK